MPGSFVFDANTCTGCGACRVACTIENGLAPDVSWRRIETFNPQHRSIAPVFHVSLACNHCTTAACMHACPALAYRRDETTRAVLLDSSLCLGCGYCSWACPYDAPVFDEAAGVMTKCTWCADRLRAGLPPACAVHCPTGALGYAELAPQHRVETMTGVPSTSLGPSLHVIPLAPGRMQPVMTADAGGVATFQVPVASHAARGTISLAREWPLAVFTFGMAALVGVVTAAAAGVVRLNAWAFIVAAVAMMGIAGAHLGRKARGYRAVLNVRRSWLSREIVTLSLFVGLTSAWLLVAPTSSTLAWAAVVAGFAGLFSADSVYAVLPGGPGYRHSAGVTLTAAVFAAALAGSVVLVVPLIALKAWMYFRWDEARRLPPLPAAIRVLAGLAAPVVLLGVGRHSVAAAACLVVGEALGRGEYYMQLERRTPRRDMDTTLDTTRARGYNPAMPALLLILLTVLASTVAGRTPAATQASSASASRFERADCPVPVAPDERIDCGVLIVPENRAKAGSRSIRLPVMIFRSRSATPAADPLLFMPGGPGGSNVAGRRSGKELPFLDDRDFVVLEQRGTRYAQPALACPATNALKGEIAAGRVRGSAAREALVAAAARCRADLVASGVDLDGYTSAETADDIEDLRKALGYQRWNLFGLSYGTRLVLTVLRRHPAGVRSVMLDSVLPPEVNFDEVAAANLQRSLNLVFDGCAVNRECASRYPDLRRRFAQMVAAADRRPPSLGLTDADTGGKPADIRGAEVVEAIYGALHNPQAIPLLPRIISDAAEGRFTNLAPFVKNNQGPSSYSWGLRYSVWCSEEMPFERPERIDAQLSPELGLGGVSEITATPEECRAWNVAAAPAEESEPVKSDVPALIMAGEFDPDTPPSWGRQLLLSMPNARYVEFRGRSHGAGFNACGGQIQVAFLRAPSSPLPVDCALKLPGADFGLSTRPR